MSIGAWEPHWIGDTINDRYAALHRPESIRASFGVLCVPPLLHEMPRSRRVVAEVASRLAAQGIPCLRFDYLGTGDAEGGGDVVDFSTIQADIQLAELALRSLVQIERVVVIAWRAAALPLAAWLASGARPSRIVLWEPIQNGAQWLAKLEAEDAEERASRRPYALRRTGRTAPADEQLMGFELSRKFREDLATTSLEAIHWTDSPVWALVRSEPEAAGNGWQRVFNLPPNAPEFGGAATVDATMFLSPGVERVVGELGQALLVEEMR